MQKKRIYLVLICISMLMFAMPACADLLPQATMPAAISNPDIFMEAELGYYGSVTYMRDIPFTVTLENKGLDLQGSVRVKISRNDMYYDLYEYPITLASGAKKSLVLPVNLKMKEDRYLIELYVGGEVAASVIKTPDRVIKPESILVGVLSKDSQSVSYMNLDSISAIATDRYEGWQLVKLDEAHFPQAASLMDAFNIIVVDGFDVSTLSSTQQQTLDRWIEAGGIVIVGGGAQAATTYPYFSKYTSLTAGSVVEAEDITPSLMEYYGFYSDDPLQKTVMLNEVTTQAAPLIASSYPLLYLTQAGGGLIYTATFELGAKPLADWPGMQALWPHILMQSATQLYVATANKVATQMSGVYYNTSLPDSVAIDNDGNTILIIALMFVYLLLVGLGSYLLLKKLDRREWMWFTIPVLTLLCIAGMYGLSQAMDFNKPAAATFTTVRMNQEGKTQASSLATIAGPVTSEALIQEENGLILTPLDDTSYYYDSGATVSSAKEQEYRILLGEKPGVGFPEKAPWTTRHVILSGSKASFGQIAGKLWMEEDGLHGEIVNNTAYAFEDGLLLTNLGYIRVKSLLPGATEKVVLKRPSQGTDTPGTSADIYQTKIQEGVMISPDTLRYNETDLNPIIQAAIYPEEQEQGAEPYAFRATLSGDELRIRNFKENAISQVVNTNDAAWTGPFHFIAFQNEIGQASFSLNGSMIKKQGHQAVVDVLLTYDPIGPTGTVYYPIGTLAAKPAESNGNGSFYVLNSNPTDKYNSYQLSLRPIFCIELPDAGKFTITDLSILGIAYDSAPIMQLYNVKTGAWDEQLLTYLSLDAEASAPYIDSDGRIFVQFLPGTSSREYDSVMTPSVSLEGRLK